jgi:hypothetical protein
MNGPAAKFQRGNVVMNVWKNVNSDRHGNEFTAINFTIKRFYENKTTKKFRLTNNFRKCDLKRMLEVITETLDFVTNNNV